MATTARSTRTSGAAAPTFPPPTERAIVIGAGIAGMTAAFRLRQRGFSVTVLEVERTIGGRMSSVIEGGFTMNRAANILPASYSTIRQLAEDVGLGGQIGPMDGIIGTLRDGTIHRLRSDRMVRDGLRTKLLPWRSKLRMGPLLVDPARRGSSRGVSNSGEA